jgi:hypothetical protein
MTIAVKTKHLGDDSGLFRINFEDLLLLATQDQRDLGAVAGRQRRAVSIPFLGIGHHHVADDAGIDFALDHRRSAPHAVAFPAAMMASASVLLVPMHGRSDESRLPIYIK